MKVVMDLVEVLNRVRVRVRIAICEAMDERESVCEREREREREREIRFSVCKRFHFKPGLSFFLVFF